MGRRGSWVWRTFFAIALIGVVAYIAFDVLDLDGSQLVGQPAAATILSDEDGPDAERVLPPDTAELSRLAAGGLLSELAGWRLQRASSVRPSASALARRHLPRHALPDDSAASADPA